MSNWTFFTNHGHVLFLLGLHPEMTVRMISQNVGITERAALRILADLEEDGYIIIKKKGRQNLYTLDLQKHLKHELERECTINDFVNVIKESKKARKKSSQEFVSDSDSLSKL